MLALPHAVDAGRRENELELMRMLALIGNNAPADLVTLAQKLISNTKRAIAADLAFIKTRSRPAALYWFCEWLGDAFYVLHTPRLIGISRKHGHLTSRDVTEAAIRQAMELRSDNPGRLRAKRLERSARELFSPFAEPLRSLPTHLSHVVIVGPSDALGTAPLEASWADDPQDPWGRVVCFAPSIRTAAVMSAQRPLRLRRALAIGYSGSDLPSISEELATIKGIYGDKIDVLHGEAAQRDNVLRALGGNYDLVHFAGHGVFDLLNPGSSLLYLGGHRDNVITADDLLGLGAFASHPVVVMSACSSAMTLPSGVNNYLGITGALMRNGASAVVGARWPVSDVATRMFSEALHSKLVEGLHPAYATRHARTVVGTAHRIDEACAYLCYAG
jgi:CHAT domain-containing protein